MLLKDLMKEHGKIFYKDKSYDYDDFVKETPYTKWETEEFEQCLDDERIFEGKWGQEWILITNDGLIYAPTNGDFIQSRVRDDLFILMGHDGFDVYELKGYKKISD